MTGPVTGPRLDAVGVVVSDMATSVAFYRRVGVAFDDGAEASDHAQADLGGGVRLMLDTAELIQSIDPQWSPTSPGRVSLAVALEQPDDVDALYAELAADGYGHAEPWDAFWGQRYATAVDPDGTRVDLYAPLPAVEAAANPT